MNSPTIAAVVPGLKTQAGPASTPDSEGQNFAEVLAGQAPAGRVENKAATPNDGTGQEQVRDTSISAAHDPADSDKKTLGPDEPTSLQALPQIALEIASHARNHVVRGEAAPARAGEIGLTHQVPAGNQAVASHPGLREGTAADALRAADQAQAVSAQRETFVNASAAQTAAAAALPVNDVVAGAAPASSSTVRGQTSARFALSTEGRIAAAHEAVDRQPASQSRADKSSSPILDAASAFEPAAMLPGGQATAAATSQPALTQTAFDPFASMPGSIAAANPFSQPGALHAAAGPAISTPLHQAGWNADFGRQVITLARDAGNGVQTAELRLDPPELGPLRISISLNDGMASAMFVSAHASVRQAIESALPQLSQQLAQAGISLGETHVGDHGQAGSAFGDGSGQSQGRATNAGSGTVAHGAMQSASAAASEQRTTTAPNSLVDTFA